MNISFKINGAFREIRGDKLIRCTNKFSREIQQYGLDYTTELSSEYATCLLAFCKGIECDSYMISILQAHSSIRNRLNVRNE